MRHVPALEGVELAPDLAEKAKRRSGRWRARSLGRESDESLTRSQPSPFRPATAEWCVFPGIDFLSARRLPEGRSKKENAAEGRRSVS